MLPVEVQVPPHFVTASATEVNVDPTLIETAAHRATTERSASIGTIMKTKVRCPLENVADGFAVSVVV